MSRHNLFHSALARFITFVALLCAFVLTLSGVAAAQWQQVAPISADHNFGQPSAKLLLTDGGLILPEFESDAPTLTFVTPSDEDTIYGTNLLIWAAEINPAVDNRQVLFQWSSDDIIWNTIPLRDSPDLGWASYTTTIDTTRMLPNNKWVYIRASASPLTSLESPAEIRVYVQQPQPQPQTIDADADCQVNFLDLQTTGMSKENDPRRKAPSKLGIDETYISYNFEIIATLTAGSDPTLCTEGQTVASTGTIDIPILKVKRTDNKMACSKGKTKATCRSNAECDIVLNKGDGVCNEYPYPKDLKNVTRGYDDYASPTELGDDPQSAANVVGRTRLQ